MGGREVGGGCQGRGCQLQDNMKENEYLNYLNEVIIAQSDDLQALFNMFKDTKVIMQAVFTLMSKEQIDELKTLYGARQNDALQELIHYNESVRKVKEGIANNTGIGNAQNKSGNENNINKTSYASKTKTSTNEVRPQANSATLPPNSPQSGRIRLVFSGEDFIFFKLNANIFLKNAW